MDLFLLQLTKLKKHYFEAFTKDSLAYAVAMKNSNNIKTFLFIYLCF